MKQPLTADERLERIESNAKRFRSLPRLALQPDNDFTLAVCGYGPSLADTWQEAAKCDRIMTTSGAHDFLIGKGVIPHYHAELDPREHKAAFVKNSHPDVTYYIAAHCHPKMLARLTYEGRKVVLYYAVTQDDNARQAAQVMRLEPVYHDVISGHTNVGMLANSIGRVLGHQYFHLHGMDCCFPNGQMWAGPHTGRRQDVVTVRVDGREYLTSPQMMESTDDMIRVFIQMPHVTFVVHGDGLLAARVRLLKRDMAFALSKRWWEPVDFYIREPVERMASIRL